MRLSGKWLAAALVLVASTEAGAQEVWSKNVVTGLGTLDRQALVLCVRGTISVNFKDTVAHNFAAGGSDSTWALKVSAHESRLMYELATDAGWVPVAEYYRIESVNAADLIRGTITLEKYRELSKSNEVILGSELSRLQESMQKVEVAMKAIYPLCQSISTKLIGSAKLRASS